MFTGIIEHLGNVQAITELDTTESGGSGFSITINECASILDDCHIGDSICVNGACLTVTEFFLENGGSFKVGLAPETLERTDLGELEVGHKVNLERAMAAHTRFGGHFVQGHVDETATILSMTPDENSLRCVFQLPPPTPERPSLMPYLIPKGYVCLDGTSLTLTQVDDSERTFGVMLIAHTQSKIVLPLKMPGMKVNVEVDMVGKYVEKAVLAALGGSQGVENRVEQMVEKILETRK
ncbi:Lumazine-binding protein [Dacryopinax primogenitus]|uniref:Riboflavin synthase n=1 Tax=Dacryopinax primogenitus (strain DJM 731) TaxID=1858805 RepID=M5G3K1_DACPD|nr:Lumazine-binding protein [Dacryopinax primogenitus]EJU02800.1 Lumazine-binding protein [Dacryopinax primogenitus]